MPDPELSEFPQIGGLEKEFVRSVAFELVSPVSRVFKRAFSGVTLRAIQGDEDIGVRASASDVTRRHADLVLGVL